jgi:hypothetical protein
MCAEKKSGSRRGFLKSSAVTAASGSLAPLFLSPAAGYAMNLTTAQNPTVGSGEFVYECIHNWDRASLPADHHYGNASHGVAIDQQGLIYITHQGSPGSLFVFDGEGRFVRAMGDAHSLNGSSKGHGIDIRKEGSEEFIYLSPSESTLFFTKREKSSGRRIGKRSTMKAVGYWPIQSWHFGRPIPASALTADIIWATATAAILSLSMIGMTSLCEPLVARVLRPVSSVLRTDNGWMIVMVCRNWLWLIEPINAFSGSGWTAPG